MLDCLRHMAYVQPIANAASPEMERQMTNYTVIRQSGEIEIEGVSLREAAEAVLGYDGHEFEFRRDGDWLELWVSRWSRNSTLGGRSLVRAADMFASLPRALSDESPRRGEAEGQIFGFVIDHADRWSGLRVMTDEAYAAEQAEIVAQLSDDE